MDTRSTELLDIAARVSRLERENRRLKRAGGLGIAALGVLALLGGYEPPQADVLEVSELRLVDGEGNVRAWLSLRDSEWSDGDVALGFVDRDGALNTALGIIGGQPRAQFGREIEDVRLALGLTGDMGRPTV